MARTRFLSWFKLSPIGERIPLQKLTGEDRDEGAPRVVLTRGVFEYAEGLKREEKLEYLRRNPITRKLVEHHKDWPWSGWSFYAKEENQLAQADPVE